MVSKTAKRAMDLFDSGYNCAESVLLALSENLAQKSTNIPRIATGFGGGVGRFGSICGALSGAVMAMGLLGGCDKPNEKEKRIAVYKQVLRMIEDFEKEFGSSHCRTLTGCDIRTEDGLKEYYAREVRKKVCPKFVGWCADYVIRGHAVV
ncbi:MAG: C-GCAxxG-C-C family protein [Candidatus Bathyarchaeia archaeon]